VRVAAFPPIYIIGVIKKYIKYVQVKICLILMKGSSTGQAPKKVRSHKMLTSAQNKILAIGLIHTLENLFFIDRVNLAKIPIDKNKAITPPSLFGIDRRIA